VIEIDAGCREIAASVSICARWCRRNTRADRDVAEQHAGKSVAHFVLGSPIAMGVTSVCRFNCAPE